MKPVFFFAAIVAVCCTAQASPLSPLDRGDDSLLVPNIAADIVADIAPAGDLCFNSAAADEFLTDNKFSGEDAGVTTGIQFRDAAARDELTLDARLEIPVRVPEPPPLEMLSLGTLGLGGLALWWRARIEKHRLRRRTLVRMRAIMAAK